jgi:hypothetical protein
MLQTNTDKNTDPIEVIHSMAKLKCPMAHLMESHVRTDGLRPSVLKKCYGQKQTVKNNTMKTFGGTIQY